MLWHIDLKFCVSLYFYARKITFECHQFPSLFAGVMLLFNFKLLHICSFPPFSPTCFDTLSSNFVYDFVCDLVYKLRRVKDTPNFISSGSKIVKRLRRRQYDPLIIETTIGLVLGPCTALCRLFLKHCTLTNKAVGTIWQALSKPPQRRQGPDLRPLWLLVGTPSAIRPELAFSRAEHNLPYSDVTIYIFAILYLSCMLYVYRFLWPLRLGWLLVCCLYKEVYLQIFKCMSFWLHGCCG